MEIAVVIVSAAAGLIGAGIGAFATLYSARGEREARTQGELVDALAHLLTTLDFLNIELDRLPRQTRAGEVTNHARSHDWLPNVFFLLDWLSRKTIGRDGELAIRTFIEAGRRAMLVAPAEVLPAFEAMTGLLAEPDRGGDWPRRWSQAGAELTAAAREAVQDLA